MDVPAIVLLGPPASGKGTQGRLLAEHWNLSYFSTGRQLRLELRAQSPIGRTAEPYLQAGHYIPDRLVLSLAMGWIERAEGGCVLDGFPRTVPQAEELDRFLGAGCMSLRAVLLEAPAEELERRVSDRRECTVCSWTGTRLLAADGGGHCPTCGGELGQRHDDDLENFRQRRQAFEELTLPVAAYYEQSDRLLRVCGTGSPEEVFRRVQLQLT